MTIWDESEKQYRRGEFKIYWELLDEIARYQYEMISGDRNKDTCNFTIEFFKERVGKEVGCGISLGCSESDYPPERIFMETGMFREFEVIDIASGLLKRQESRMKKLRFNNINYICQDLNQVKLSPNKYHLIWALGTIHHLEKLEEIFNEISKGLTQNGIFVMREYIGPNRIQFRFWQLLLVNLILQLLPKRLRLQFDGSIKKRQYRTNKKELIANDPSEAIRSQDIVPLIKKYFTIIHYSNTGGTLLMPLLSNIASNFEGNKLGEIILKLLIFIEKSLIHLKIIPSDYCFAICSKSM